MIWENALLAISSLRANKMRALLTMLGIIIGIMSIITIVILGDGLTAAVQDDLAIFGTNNIIVSVQERSRYENDGPNDPFAPFMQPAGVSIRGITPQSEDLISDQMIADMITLFYDEIDGVSLSHSRGAGVVRDGVHEANVTISGVNTDALVANNLNLLYGRLISETDLKERAMVTVVSDRLVARIFPDGTDPIGQQVKLFLPTSIEVYTIIGVYEHEFVGFLGTAALEDMPTPFHIPLTTARQDLIEQNFTTITVISSLQHDVHEVTRLIQAYFDVVFIGNEYWRVSVTNMASMLDVVIGVVGTISLVVAMIAGISLFVGGIGVMNIMLVSVTERTREIGTRKALGAKNFHIQAQFVIEALVIALVGGIIGMLLGILGGICVTPLVVDAPIVISPGVVVGSMLFSMAIGVFFGIYPANKAAKLDPIEALRYE
ncbi:MAG: ABC transporter permease [Firmicutes bacterium]|nr:ABC transporter permease [Bacillota bacterium]